MAMFAPKGRKVMLWVYGFKIVALLALLIWTVSSHAADEPPPCKPPDCMPYSTVDFSKKTPLGPIVVEGIGTAFIP
jgi:hypothetical protein